MFIVCCSRSQQQTLYRRLHCQLLVCFNDRRDEEAAGKIAKNSLAIPPPFPEQKERILFTSDTTAVAKTTIEVTKPVICADLHAGDVGWRVLQDISLHACLKAKVFTPRGLFGLLLTGVNR